LFMFDLFLFNLLVEIAPIAAGDDQLVDLELRMNAHCPIKQISVERIGRGKPDAGQTILALPLNALQPLLQIRLRPRHDLSTRNELVNSN